MSDRYRPQHLLRDEIDWTGAAEGKVLTWDDALKKLVFVDQTGGGGGSEQYAIIPILAGNAPILAGETAKPGFAFLTTAVLADATQVILYLTLSASEAGSAVVTWRDETSDVVLWTDTVTLTAGQNDVANPLALGDGFPTGANKISITVSPDVDVVATCAQVWMVVF